MTSRSHRLALSVLSTLSLTLVSALVSAEPVRIGASMSQTGDYAIQGRAAQNGYRLCEAHINRDGGLLGREVEFLIYDDQSSTSKVQEIYQQLITQAQVDLVMGPYGSTLTEALAPVTEAHQMVQITPLAATSSIWEQGREYLFMVLPPAELFLAGLIDIATSNDFERIAIVHEDALFPTAAATGAEQLANEQGMQVMSFESYPSGQTDFEAFVQSLVEQDVEVLAMAASNLHDFVKMQRALKDHDVRLKMFGTSGAVQEFGDELGDDANGVFGLSAWEPSAPNPGAQAFTEAYQQAFGQAPAFHSAGAYASCQLLAEAVRTAGSLEQSAIRDVLLELETTTVFGAFAVDERGYQIAHQGLFIQWQEGEKVVVWPASVAQDNIKW